MTTIVTAAHIAEYGRARHAASPAAVAAASRIDESELDCPDGESPLGYLLSQIHEAGALAVEIDSAGIVIAFVAD